MSRKNDAVGYVTMEAENMQQLHAVVSGRVQGVNFRAYTRREAVNLGLSGWVRNRSDGAVEVAAEGTDEALAAFVDFLHRGSPSAAVSHVEVTWKPASGEFVDFEVRYF